MDGSTGMLILYIVIGFFGFVTIVCGTLFWIFWNRRKLVFTNFLSDTGQWERKGWKPNKIGKDFTYDGQPYEFDIKLCTRDKINRPIAHYYKGNPKQQKFDYTKGNKALNVIDTMDITGKDFIVLMTSKVLRDIFQDEELMNWLLMILIAIIGSTIVVVIMILAYNPPVTLKADNTTIALIKDACKQAFTRV